MAVIGRLDNQVDSVLIAPLDRNRRDKMETEVQPENQPPASSQTDARAQGEDESFQNERAAREELPVWLL
jgi:hypothetical protein